MERGRDGGIAILLAIGAAAIFYLSPVHNLQDSHYALLLSESLACHGTLRLDRAFHPPLDPSVYPGLQEDGLPYHVERLDGHFYYWYPNASSILSTPFVAAMEAAGLRMTTPSGIYRADSERFGQRILASILGGVVAAIFYFIARLRMSRRASAAAGGLGVLGSQVWSVTSRSLWSSSWELVFLSLAVLLLSRLELGRSRNGTVLLGTCLCWAYFCRPTGLGALIVVGIGLALFHRELLGTFASTVALWMIGFVALSRFEFQTWLPSYFRGDANLDFGFRAIAVAGNLVSPSRGELVFSPVLLLVGYRWARAPRSPETRRLAWLAAAACAAQLAMVGMASNWWGGHSYGPRLMTDAVPWLYLLGILAFTGWRPAIHPFETSALLLLSAASIFLHGRGALSPATQRWNESLPSTNESPARLWDWRHPQFLAGLE